MSFGYEWYFNLYSAPRGISSTAFVINIARSGISNTSTLILWDARIPLSFVIAVIVTSPTPDGVTVPVLSTVAIEVSELSHNTSFKPAFSGKTSVFNCTETGLSAYKISGALLILTSVTPTITETLHSAFI